MKSKKNIAVVGAGFTGSVIAERLASLTNHNILLFDSRDHIAGNCHTERCSSTNIMIHKYGPHIFNTSYQDVWEYITKFGDFMPYTNRVKADTERGIFSLPMNLLTINQFFNKKFNPSQAIDFVKNLGEPIEEPQNFEEQALKLLGSEIYENFFKHYTIKQWGRNPKDLPASILKRLPIRFTYDDNYYNTIYQGIPREGYTKIVEKMIDQPSIKLFLNQNFDRTMCSDFDHVFYSGPIDQFFNYSEGRLRYRTVYFKESIHDGDYQGNAVINYCSGEKEYTRVSEHKHFSPWEEHSKTVVFHEFSKETGEGDIPFYPLGLTKDKEVLERYKARSQENRKINFVGRLGSYQYLNMDVCIKSALDLSYNFIQKHHEDCL